MGLRDKRGRLSSSETLARNGLPGATIRYFFCFGLASVLALGSGCRNKLPPVEAPPISATTNSLKSKNSVSAATLIPLNRSCRALTGVDEIKCLCPAPLPYAISSQRESSDHNFSADIDIKKTARPMFRVRIFSFGELENINSLLGVPNDTKSLNLIERMESDPDSVILLSTAPKDEFKLTLSTPEALQLKCVNQED